ncbi:helix-turn-helix domain-containing protein [Thermodesulfatator indicus]
MQEKKVPAFGKNLKEALKAAGVKAKDVAKDLRVSPVTVSRWLSDTREPSLAVLYALKQKYGVNPFFVITGEGPPVLKTSQKTVILPREKEQEELLRQEFESLVLLVELVGGFEKPDFEQLCKQILEKIYSRESIFQKIIYMSEQLFARSCLDKYSEILGFDIVSCGDLQYLASSLRELILNINNPPTSMLDYFVDSIYFLIAFSIRDDSSSCQEILKHPNIFVLLPDYLKISLPDSLEDFFSKIHNGKFKSKFVPDYIRKIKTSEKPVPNLIVQAYRDLWELIESENIPKVCRIHSKIYWNYCLKCVEIANLTPQEQEIYELLSPSRLHPAQERAMDIYSKPSLCASVLDNIFLHKARTISEVLLSLNIIHQIYYGEKIFERYFQGYPSYRKESVNFAYIVDSDFYLSLNLLFVKYYYLAKKYGITLEESYFDLPGQGYLLQGDYNIDSLKDYVKYIEEKMKALPDPAHPYFLGKLAFFCLEILNRILRAVPRLDVSEIVNEFNVLVWPFFKKSAKFYPFYLQNSSLHFLNSRENVILNVINNTFMISLKSDPLLKDELDFTGLLDDLLMLYYHTFGEECSCTTFAYVAPYAICLEQRRLDFKGLRIVFPEKRKSDLLDMVDLIEEFVHEKEFDLFVFPNA